MLSERADRFLAELKLTPGMALCPKCAKVLLGLEHWEVIIRELIGGGHILCRWGTCPGCGDLQLVARLRHDRPAA
jgi:hypothetical protein